MEQGPSIVGWFAFALLGLDAAAQAPPLAWRRARVLECKIDAATAYDAARQRVVLFGGSPSACDSCPERASDETWEWDGATWTRRDPSTRPSPRWGSAMAYDRARQRVVLFGGRYHALGYHLLDTWEWNGVDWTARHPATSPPGRTPLLGARMVHDEARARTLMVVSNVANQITMWEWDGIDWTQRTPVHLVRALGAWFYDGLRQRVHSLRWPNGWSSDSLGEVWEWDGNEWNLHATADFPPALDAK